MILKAKRQLCRQKYIVKNPSLRINNPSNSKSLFTPKKGTCFTCQREVNLTVAQNGSSTFTSAAYLLTNQIVMSITNLQVVTPFNHFHSISHGNYSFTNSTSTHKNHQLSSFVPPASIHNNPEFLKCSRNRLLKKKSISLAK